MDIDRLRHALTETPELRFFTEIDMIESTGSTNADLLARTEDPEVDRVVLVAEAQEQGRGRLARAWASPPRAQISLSLLVRTDGLDPALLGWLPLLTGTAVVDALRAEAGVPAALKWPNDVLIEGRKIAGILTEAAAAVARPAVVIGVGVNVSLGADELPVPHATSLTLCEVPDPDRTALVLALLTEFAKRYTAWRDAGWATDDLAAAYRERCATLGTPVRAELPGGGLLTGIARDIDSSGRLLIGEQAVSAGDITHLRPN